jgi:type IV secretion system protein VirD4
MIDKNAIFLGTTPESGTHILGFGGQTDTCVGQPIFHDMETPILTIAPTGSGKGVSCIIPTLLTLDMPTIVVDIKGEAFQVTSEQRERMGHHVTCIDPFMYTGVHMYRGALNPLDLIQIRDQGAVDNATSLAAVLAPMAGFSSDPFWDRKAQQIIAGFTLAVSAFATKPHRNLTTVRRLMNSAPSELAPVLRAMVASKNYDGWMADTAKQLMSMPDKTASSVMATVTYILNPYGTTQIRRSLSRTTFSTFDLIEGRDLTIYLVLPPDKLISHSSLLRLWLSTLARMMFLRRNAPAKPCLLIIDEAAQLGSLDEMRVLITLMRGYGVIPWIFFQSLSQLKQLYPDWRTFVENCGTIQIFGFNSQFNVDQALALTGYAGSQLLLGSDRKTQIIAQSRQPHVVARLRNYLEDPELLKRARINTLARKTHIERNVYDQR